MNAVVTPPTGSTTMTALKDANAQAPINQLPAVQVGFTNLQSFELAQRAAKLLASSTLVPKDYQNNIPNCVIALNMASRIGADPLLVMQNLYVVHGRPGWSAQFTIACFNQCGRFSAMRYKFTGAEGTDAWSCQAYAVEKETGEVISGPVISIGMAKKEGWYNKSGSKWQTIPQLMLMYRAGAWLARTHAPEISMGLQTQEELHDVYDAQQGRDGRYAVDIDALRSAAPAAAPTAEPSSPPRFDEAAEIEVMRRATSQAELDKYFEDLEQRAKAAGVDLTVAVDAAYEDRKAVLEQKL